MQPSIEMRLRAMMRAMSEVVLPALDATNRAAAEQGGLVLGSLGLLLQQVDYAHWYEQADLAAQCDLADQLAAIEGAPVAAGFTQALSAARAMSPRHDVSLSMLKEANVQLRDAISTFIESAYALNDTAAAAALQRRVQALVLAQSQQQLSRERAYVAGMRWDMYPDSLQSIEASLVACRVDGRVG